MEKNRNQKILDIENNLLQYKEEINVLNNEVKELYKKKEALFSELECLNEEDDKSEILGRIESNNRAIFINTKIKERKEELINSATNELIDLMPNKIDMAKYKAWLKMQKIKPSVDDISGKAKIAVEDMKRNFNDKFNKEKFGDKFEKVKDNKKFQTTAEKAKVVKEEIVDLNLYKMIGQFKKNTMETIEDIKGYIEENDVEEKVKGKVDKYVSPEVKGRLSSFFNKVKESLNEAAEIISDNEENEAEVEIREKLRKFKGVKENYIKSWIRENKIIIDNNARSNINEIHTDYLNFMKDEYGQEENSKLMVIDYNEFVKISAKYFNLPIVFNSDEGIINLKINKSS